MPRQFRVVRYVDTTRHRVVRHPTIPKTKPGGGNLGGESIRDKLGLGEGMSLQDFLAGLGIHTPGSPGSMGPNGPTSSYYSPVGPGTAGGAVLGLSGGGRALQQLINSHYGFDLGGKSWGDLTGPSGRFGHRGTSGQWVGEPSAIIRNQRVSPRTAESGGTNANWTYPDWAYEAAGAVRDLKYAMPYMKQSIKLAGRMYSLLKKYWRLVEYPVGPGGPVSPSPYAGYYPTVEGPAGRLSPHEAAMMLRHLVSQHRWGTSAPWWHNQWLYSRTAASSAGSNGGGGTSAAPERFLLGGMKHPYDWVAGLTYT